MTRCAAVVLVAFALGPAPLMAQDTAITITAASADVYKGPTTVSAVIGHVSRGTVVPVLKDLGSWVRITWPDGQDGAGYVHVTMGRIAPAAARDTARTSPSASAAPSPAAVPQTPHAPLGGQIVPHTRQNVTTISHLFGVGGLVAPMNRFGATARAWHGRHVGIQLGFTRDAMTSDVVAGRVTSTQFEPGVVYALFDRISDYVWLRPYIGSTVSFHHQTFRDPARAAGLAAGSDNGVGFRVFAGSEATFSSMPRLGVSADLGYRRVPHAFPAFEPNPLSVSIAAHWYIR